MNNSIDTRKLSPQERMELRRIVIRLREQSGMPSKMLAQTVGVHHRTVETWLSRANQEDEDLLGEKKRGRPVGACRKLTLTDERWLRETIECQAPQQMKLPFALWTYSAIRLLVKEHLGIEMQNRLIAKYLKRWGFTAQRPINRVLGRRSEDEVWLKQTYPDLQARAKAEGALIYWGNRSVAKKERKLARDGPLFVKKPVFGTPARMDELSVVTVVSPRGEVAFRIFEGGFDAERFREFLALFIEDMPRKIYLLVDDLYAYHAELNAWLADRSERIELVPLQSYAPKFNSDDVDINQMPC